jgi:hypothetical protein
VIDENGYGGLAHAISMYHGGFAKFRAMLGQENMQGRWKDLEYTIQQLEHAMHEEGWKTLPCQDVLNQNGYSSIASAINRHHGGFVKFRQILGQEGPMGRWKDINYTIKRAQQALQKEGWAILPSLDVLEDNGYSGLGAAIIRYHGGFPAFRKILGQETMLERWKNRKYAKEQALQAMQKERWETLPGAVILEKKGYSRLYSAIREYHGGLPAFRNMLGQENPLGRWKDINYTIRQAQQALLKEGWTMLPTSHVLNDRGYSSLGYAISTYHGGFPAFREMLTKSQGQPTHKEHLENLLRDYVDKPDQDHDAACGVPA